MTARQEEIQKLIEASHNPVLSLQQSMRLLRQAAELAVVVETEPKPADHLYVSAAALLEVS